MSSLISYAQNFEDVMLWRALKDVENGFYIDIGAQDPVIDSVSLAFHEHGWKGIHVEPSPHYAQLLREQRPGDVVLEVAVGIGSNLISFFEIPDTGISTAKAEIAEQHRERGFNVREINVPCVALSSIFEICRDREIHWMKVDVEAFEFEVLKSWGKSKTRPWILVVESTLPLTQIESHKKWEMLLTKRGYLSVYFDGLNRYYLAAERADLKKAFQSPPNLFDGFILTRNSWPWCTQLKIEIQQAEQKIEAEKEAAAVRYKTRETEFSGSLEAHQTKAANQLLSLEAKSREMGSRNVQLVALLQACEFQLQQAVTSSSFFENELRKSALQASDLIEQSETGRVELAHVTQQCAQNVARLGNELGAQIARNVSLNTDLNAERIKANATNELLIAARAEVDRSKDFHAKQEKRFDRDLSIEKALNQQRQSENLKNELKLVAHQETFLRQTIEMSEKNKAFTNELNLVVVEQANHIDSIEKQNLLDTREHEQSLSEAESKITELSHHKQLSCTRLGLQEHLQSQLEQTIAALCAELQYIKQAYTWRLTAPFRWFKSVSFGVAPPTSPNIMAAPFQPLSAATAAVSNELTMPSTDSPKKISESEISDEIVHEPRGSNELFISRTYKNLLGREPEPAGAALYLDRLNNNVPRETIFREIQTSEEARPHAVVMDLAKAVVLNAYVEDLDAAALLAMHDKAFVVAAYQQLLKRNPDLAGYTSYLHALRSGVAKLQILHEIRNSSEGNIHKQFPRGLEDLLRGHEREKIVFFGRIFKVFSKINRIQSIENSLQRIESQIATKRSDDIEQSSQHASRLMEAEIAMRALIDKKITGLLGQVGSQLLKSSEQNRQRFEDIDVVLHRQSVVLQRAAIKHRLQLTASAVSNDEHVAEVFNELKTAIASKRRR